MKHEHETRQKKKGEFKAFQLKVVAYFELVGKDRER